MIKKWLIFLSAIAVAYFVVYFAIRYAIRDELALVFDQYEIVKITK